MKKDKIKSVFFREEISLLSRIDDLVNNKISTKFSTMMSKLGNTGSVLLDRSDNPKDLKGYGISIMVRFTANHRSKATEMQRLSSTMHSGGEKSVSTALYMMALQELTKVPFRCVDEINQGAYEYEL